MKKNKNNNNSTKLIIFISIIVCIALLIYYVYDNRKIDFNEILIKDIIILPSTSYGDLLENTDHSINMNIRKVTKDDYNFYVDLNKNKGFIFDIVKEDNYYKASNIYGYTIEINYTDSSYNVKLNASNLTIPNNEYTSLIPSISSNYGAVNKDSEDEFIMYINNYTKEMYDNYVNSCITSGFNLDNYKLTSNYLAKNKDKYILSLEYLNGDIMKVNLSSTKYSVRLLLNYIKDDQYSDYDINVYIDNKLSDILKVGELKEYILSLKYGDHTLKLQSVDNSNIVYTKELKVEEGLDLNYKIVTSNDLIYEDLVSPEIQSFKITSPTDGEVKYTNEIVTRLEFTEKVIGTPGILKLKVGSNEVICNLKESGSNYIDYTYTPTRDDYGKIEFLSYESSLTDISGNVINNNTVTNTGYNVSIRKIDSEQGGNFKKTATLSKGSTINYWIYLPKVELVDYYDDLPLVVMLPMAGIDSMSEIGNYSLMKYTKEGTISPKAIIVMPQLCAPLGEFKTANLKEFIDGIVDEYKVNKNKIALCGHSRGARIALRTAKAYPNYFSCCLLLSWMENGVDKHDMQTLPMPDCKTLFVYEPASAYNSKIAKKLSETYSNIEVVDLEGEKHGTIERTLVTKDYITWMINQTKS